MKVVLQTLEERPEDIDDGLRKDFIDTLLSRKDQLKLTLVCITFLMFRFV